MNYGSLVAFIHAGAIAFGVLMEKVTRENAAGETTEYVIELGDASKTRVTITDDDDIKELPTEYPSLLSDYTGKLHARSAMFECAKERSHAIRFPTTVATPEDRDSSCPSPDEGASDVPLPASAGKDEF